MSILSHSQQISNSFPHLVNSLPSCRRCHGREFHIGAGKHPHHAQLMCSACDRHIKWLTKNTTFWLTLE